MVKGGYAQIDNHFTGRSYNVNGGSKTLSETLNLGEDDSSFIGGISVGYKQSQSLAIQFGIHSTFGGALTSDERVDLGSIQSLYEFGQRSEGP